MSVLSQKESARQTALSLAQHAVASDHAGQYEQAIQAYTQATNFLYQAAAYEPRSQEAAQLTSQAMQYKKRAHTLTHMISRRQNTAQEPPMATLMSTPVATPGPIPMAALGSVPMTTPRPTPPVGSTPVATLTPTPAMATPGSNPLNTTGPATAIAFALPYQQPSSTAAGKPLHHASASSTASAETATHPAMHKLPNLKGWIRRLSKTKPRRWMRRFVTLEDGVLKFYKGEGGFPQKTVDMWGLELRVLSQSFYKERKIENVWGKFVGSIPTGFQIVDIKGNEVVTLQVEYAEQRTVWAEGLRDTVRVLSRRLAQRHSYSHSAHGTSPVVTHITSRPKSMSCVALMANSESSVPPSVPPRSKSASGLSRSKSAVSPAVRLQLSADNIYNLTISKKILSKLNFSPLPLEQRSLATSNFKQIYSVAMNGNVPRLPAELLTSVTKLVEWFAADKGLKREGTETFLREINGDAFKHHQELVNNLSNAAEYLWTCAKKLPNNSEFCGLVNEALRRDEPEALLHAVVLVNAINRKTRIALRGEGAASSKTKFKFPHNGLCYRGGGFRNRFIPFFTVGKRFRCAQFIATSFSERKARQFVARAPAACPRILWTIQVDHRGRDDPAYITKHANYVTKTLIRGEEEYLFAPYSVFSVKGHEWGTTAFAVHEVVLKAAVDNRAEPEDLPLAPWM